MKYDMYSRGNAMVYPLEVMESSREDLRYLYPLKTADLQKMICAVCRHMEYPGSMMYDQYPDKNTVHRMSQCICEQYKKENDNCREDAFLCPLVEVMLCHEMECRRKKENVVVRNRRKCGCQK